MLPVYIALIVIVFLVILVMVTWPLLLRRFATRYYLEQYSPEELQQEEQAEIPESFHLSDIPWFTANLRLGQSISLQMIAAYYEVDYPRSYHDFLMGLTYGATRLPGGGFSPMGTDPEIGLSFAAPYLGLARHYITTDDGTSLLSAMRSRLAQGFPIRIAVDMSSLYGQSEFISHSEVLVGYDPNGFYYYETVGLPPAKQSPGSLPPGEPGIFISDHDLLRAIGRMSQEFKYPWRYAFTIFETADTQDDLRPVWTRNGNALIEDAKYGPKMGARVIEDLADQIVRDGPKFDLSLIRSGVLLAAELRQENGDFLRQVFPHETDLLEAAAQMDLAAKNYRLVIEDIQDGISSQIEAKRLATRLREAAGAERKAGEIFRQRGLPAEEMRES